tara:strand:- start:198 stop:539 length:342 start_codon:yes stop_codon:yes gene_type:complete
MLFIQIAFLDMNRQTHIYKKAIMIDDSSIVLEHLSNYIREYFTLFLGGIMNKCFEKVDNILFSIFETFVFHLENHYEKIYWRAVDLDRNCNCDYLILYDITIQRFEIFDKNYL